MFTVNTSDMLEFLKNGDPNRFYSTIPGTNYPITISPQEYFEAEEGSFSGKVFNVNDYLSPGRVEGVTNDRPALRDLFLAASNDTHPGNRIIYLDPSKVYHFQWTTAVPNTEPRHVSILPTINADDNYKIIVWAYNTILTDQIRLRFGTDCIGAVWGGFWDEIVVPNMASTAKIATGLNSDVELKHLQRVNNIRSFSQTYMGSPVSKAYIYGCDYRMFDAISGGGRDSTWFDGKNILMEDCVLTRIGNLDDTIILKDESGSGTENVLVRRIHIEKGLSPAGIGDGVYNYVRHCTFEDITFDEVVDVVSWRLARYQGVVEDILVQRITNRDTLNSNKMRSVIQSRVTLQSELKNCIVRNIDVKLRHSYRPGVSNNAEVFTFTVSAGGKIDDLLVENIKIIDPLGFNTNRTEELGQSPRRVILQQARNLYGGEKFDATFRNVSFEGSIRQSSAMLIDLDGFTLDNVNIKLNNSQKGYLETGGDCTVLNPGFDGSNDKLISYIANPNRLSVSGALDIEIGFPTSRDLWADYSKRADPITSLVKQNGAGEVELRAGTSSDRDGGPVFVEGVQGSVASSANGLWMRVFSNVGRFHLAGSIHNEGTWVSNTGSVRIAGNAPRWQSDEYDLRWEVEEGSDPKTLGSSGIWTFLDIVNNEKYFGGTNVEDARGVYTFTPETGPVKTIQVGSAVPNVLLKAKRDGSPVDVVKCCPGSQWIDENWICYSKISGKQESGWQIQEPQFSNSDNISTSGFGPSDLIQLTQKTKVKISSENWSDEVALIKRNSPQELVQIITEDTELELDPGNYGLVGGLNSGPTSFAIIPPPVSPPPPEENLEKKVIIIPIGRANFAALVEQKPKPKDGINIIYDEDTLKLIHIEKYEPKEIIVAVIYKFLTGSEE